MTTSPGQQQIDEQHMDRALKLARQAFSLGEIPVGAVVVLDGKTLGEGHNRCVMDTDPSAHAEVVAMRFAAKAHKNYRLDGATLYVTLEPCLMCCGALLQSRVKRLVYGVREPRTGGVVSVHESLRLPGVDHHVAITEGIRAHQSAELLSQFFKDRRQVVQPQPVQGDGTH
ncbi:MAG: tRNA adenosine(34) deaminase TadA [Granulosicoccus sp.]